MNPHLLSLFYRKNAATNMLNYISYAIITLALLMFFMTPVGLCLLLASPFWTVGMDVVFYFVVSAVLAVVAVLFAVIVRFIWVVLLLQGGSAKDEEAVSAGHRVIDFTAAGKYDDQPKEAPGADDLVVVSRSSPSANRSRIGHSNPEYPSLVGGSRSNLRLLEKDVDSAGLFSSKPRMPEGGDAYAHHSRLSSYATLARDVCIAATAAAVDKEFRGLAVPCTCGVAHASARSFEVDSRRCSPSGVTACSTGVSDGAFVASAANVADMMGAVDAPSVGGSCVAGAADPLGEASAGMPSAAAIGATGDLGAGSAGTLVVSGSAASGDAMNKGTPILGDAPSAGIAARGASDASLVRRLAPSLGSVLGSKRCIEDENVGLGYASHVQAKKQKVAPLGDGAWFTHATVGVPAAVPSGFGAFGAALAPVGGIVTGATTVDDPMDICVPTSSPPLCPIAMDVDVTAATTPMDLDDNNFDPIAWEPSAMDISADGDLFFLPPVYAASTASPTAVMTTTTFLTPMPAAEATTTTTSDSSTPTIPAATPAPRRRIARARVPSELRRAAILNAARQHSQQAASTTHTTGSCAASTTVETSTTTATAPVAASADTASTASSTNAVCTTTSSTPRLELEEFDLDPVEILDPNEYPKPNGEYDEFEGFDFSSEEFENIMKELDHELS
ncbi:hypothetical protein MBANPS3_012220 [Mucor bainieri]